MVRRTASVLFVLAVGLALTFAQDATAPTLGIAADAQWGNHLVDAEGNSVYLYEKDAQGASTCVDACTNNWPPVLVTGDPVGGTGVEPSLLGAIERPDGSKQVTYDGWPLYTFKRDANAGDTHGQKLGGLFFLVASDGSKITEELPPQKVEISQQDFDALMATGQQKFASICSACHGANGEGKVGPKLDGNDILQDSTFVAKRILNGFVEHGMPPFRDQFSDFEIASAATYVRNSWSNDFGAVTEEEVAKLR